MKKIRFNPNYNYSIMEKLKIIFKALFVFTICVNIIACTTNTKPIYPEERVMTREHVPFTNIVEFGYRGHDYIKFSTGHNAGVVHNPECHCYHE